MKLSKEQGSTAQGFHIDPEELYDVRELLKAFCLGKVLNGFFYTLYDDITRSYKF